MSSNGKTTLDLNTNEKSRRPTVRFDSVVHTDQDPPPTEPINDENSIDFTKTTVHPNRPVRRRRKSGILKRRENTITTADAPRIILSDEGLKAGRVSPFINFPLFLSMSIRSVGIVFGDM